MTGLGETTRGKDSRRHKAPPAEAPEEKRNVRKMSPSEEGLVAVRGI